MPTDFWVGPIWFGVAVDDPEALVRWHANTICDGLGMRVTGILTGDKTALMTVEEQLHPERWASWRTRSRSLGWP